MYDIMHFMKILNVGYFSRKEVQFYNEILPFLASKVNY